MNTARAITYASIAVACGLILYGAYLHGARGERNRLTAIHQAELAASNKAKSEALQEAASMSEDNMRKAMEIERLRLEAQRMVQSHFNDLEQRALEYANTNDFLHGCGLDAAGLRLWNEANRGRAGAGAADVP